MNDQEKIVALRAVLLEIAAMKPSKEEAEIFDDDEACSSWYESSVMQGNADDTFNDGRTVGEFYVRTEVSEIAQRILDATT